MCDGWFSAIDRELIRMNIGVAYSDDTYEVAADKLQTLIDLHIAIAIDPSVNGGYKLVKVNQEENRMATNFNNESNDDLLNELLFTLTEEDWVNLENRNEEVYLRSRLLFLKAKKEKEGSDTITFPLPRPRSF